MGAVLAAATLPGVAGSAEPAAAPSANPFRTAAPAGPAAAATPESRRAASDQALLDARRALSVGDLARAQQYLGQAQQLDVAYEGPGDSPQKVAESIAVGQELAALRKTTNGGEAWRQGYAKLLVAQADALLSWNDLEQATRAASEAEQLNPNFANTGLTPKSVLKRIAERRNSARTAGDSALAGAASAPPAAPRSIADAKGQTIALLAQARAALRTGDLAAAEKFASQASALNVPDTQFAPTEDRPSKLAADLLRARSESGGTTLANVGLPQTSTPGADDYLEAATGIALPAPMRIAELPPAQPLPLPGGAGPVLGGGDPLALLEAGEAALKAGDREGALENFRAAYPLRQGLDLLAQQRLQGHLQLLSASSPDASGETVPAPEGEMLDAAAAGQSLVARQLSAEVSKRQSEAARMRESNPVGSLRVLREAITLVEQSALEEALKRQLLSRINTTLADTEKYIDEHKAELELDAANKEILDEIERER
ncbi:MAG TPA: hypothetical protein VEQ85_06905, partial [Lacipirellulaceae bacterium]|nr:hypothetical protein [Lacipirellulaceae bacterium]